MKGKERTQRRKAAQRELARVHRNRRLLVEAHREVADLQPAPRTNLDPASAVQEILDNIMAMYRYATSMVITLEEDEYWRETIAGKIPNEWIREQERLGMQAVHVAGKAAGMGLAERAVRIQEAQAAMFGSVVEAALVSIGLDFDQRRQAHEIIAERLETIEAEGDLIQLDAKASVA